MADVEVIAGMEGVLARFEPSLNAGQERLEQAQRQSAEAQHALGDSMKNVHEADSELTNAKRAFSIAEREKWDAAHKISLTAEATAVALVRDPSLDPINKTLGALVFSDSGVALHQGSKGYYDHLVRGLQAVGGLQEQLSSSVPIFYSSSEGFIAERHCAAEELVATLPNIRRSLKEDHLQGGQISLRLSNGQQATPTYGELVLVRKSINEITLISDRPKEGIEHLESLCNNSGKLILGREAIEEKLAALDIKHRFIGLTALEAADVKVEREIDPGFKEQVTGKLLNVVAHYAEPVTAANKKGMDERIETAAMIRSINRPSVRYMAQALGFTSAQFSDLVHEKLDDEIAVEKLNATLQSIFR